MDIPKNDGKIEYQLRHSILGILATIISFLPISVTIIMIIVILQLEKNGGYNHIYEGLDGFIAFGFIMFKAGIITFSIGVITSIIGLIRKKTKKHFLYVGLILNVAMLLSYLFIGKMFIIG